MRVLIVEDDKGWRDSLSESFKSLGHEVVGSAANGASALELFRQHRPDLVTMDGELGKYERGLGVAKQVRREDPNVIIVMISTTQGLAFEGRGICKGDIEGLDSFRDLLAAQLSPSH